jgi:hypothetical protein
MKSTTKIIELSGSKRKKNEGNTAKSTKSKFLNLEDEKVNGKLLPQYYKDFMNKKKEDYVPKKITYHPSWEESNKDPNILSFRYESFICDVQFKDLNETKEQQFVLGDIRGNPFISHCPQQFLAQVFFSFYWILLHLHSQHIKIPNPITKSLREKILWNQIFQDASFFYNRVDLPFDVPFPVTFGYLAKALYYERYANFTISVYQNNRKQDDSNNNSFLVLDSKWTPQNHLIEYVQKYLYPVIFYRCQSSVLCNAFGNCYVPPPLSSSSSSSSNQSIQGILYCRDHYPFTFHEKDPPPAGIRESLQSKKMNLISSTLFPHVENKMIGNSRIKTDYYFTNTKVPFQVIMNVENHQNIDQYSKEFIFEYPLIFWDIMTLQDHLSMTSNEFLVPKPFKRLVVLRFNPDFYVQMNDPYFYKVIDPVSRKEKSFRKEFLSNVLEVFHSENPTDHLLVRRILRYKPNVECGIFVIKLFFNGFHPKTSIDDLQIEYLDPLKCPSENHRTEFV